jgi:hypothetical protein
MTDRQFEKCVKNKIPIYKIWISTNGSKIHCKKCSYVQFENSWISRGWINECVWFGTDDTRGMYVSGNNLNKCKLKLINELKREKLQKIKKAEKQFERLRKIKEELK